MPQRGLRGAPLVRDVAVDERVLDLLRARRRPCAPHHRADTPTTRHPKYGRVPITCSSRRRVELVVGDAELVAQHVVGVLAERRRRAGPVRVGPGRHAHRPGRVLAARRRADVSIGSKKPRALHLRIVERRVRGHHRRGRDARRARSSAAASSAVRVAHHAARSSACIGSRVAVDGDPLVVARASVHAACAAPVEQRAVDRSSGSPARRSPRSRPRPAALRRAGPRRCARGARARRRVASAACVPTIGSTRPPGMIGGPPS